MDNQGKGLIKALENWAKKVTKGYRDVDVHDMSSSFRDGLAFCAIIHNYRPDLIDFDSLSKENIQENNQIAFSIAEKQLGVPALLDAEDMVKYSRPDRLSIITYLSQLHNCFENQNKVKGVYKRMPNSLTGTPPKVFASEPKLLTTRRIEVCQVCNNRVFLLERLIVNGKLYHTACFKCCKCNSLLNPGAYIESDSPGKYECSVCPVEEKSNGMDTDDTESHSSLEEKNHLSLNSVDEPVHTIQNSTVQKSPLSEVVTRARTSFLENSLTAKSNRLSFSKLDESSSLNNKEPLENLTNGVSVKAKISAFESSQNIKSSETKLNELPSASKVKDSVSSTPLNSILKSPKPSFRLSLISPDSEKSENFSKKEVEEMPKKSTMEIKECTSDTVSHKISPKEDLPEPSSDTLNCDNISKLSANKVPISDVPPSQNMSTSFRTSVKDSDKSISGFRKSLEEYRSPLKGSRDIFKTSIQPLQFSIPTINTTSRKNSDSLSVTPLRSSSDVSKSPVEIAQLRSSYSRSLSRPLSSSSLLSKERDSKNTETDILNNKYNLTKPRRKSLESNVTNAHDSTLKDSPESSINSIKTHYSSTELDSKHNGTKLGSQEKLTEVISSATLSPEKLVPIPSIRLSLEPKKVELQREKSELRSITKILSSNEKISQKSPEESPNITQTSPKDIVPEQPKSVALPVAPIPPPEASIPPEENAEDYPDDLNPFGDDDPTEEYPDDLNPFGDDDVTSPKIFEGVSADNYDESKNPFASDEEESISYSTPSPRPPKSQNNSPFNTMSSPTGSLRGTTKKRKAPKPPKMSDIFPSEANDSFNSLKASPAVSRRSLETPSPKLRKNKPAPPPPVTSPKQAAHTDVSVSSKDADNLKSSVVKETSPKEHKKKKRPAPPVPIPMRKDKRKIPLKEIMQEMKEIEAKQRDYEKQGREIELLIRDRDKDEEPSVEEEEYIMQLFELVNQKNALFRRQAELMYIKRSQRLEEQQEELEKQIRQLMGKPENEKTDEDRAKEEELIYEFKDVVDQRNSIIDSIEMDRRRELEEDVSVQEQIETKNGDLPLAAEIKEKNKGKTKKEKKKKDKKEKKDKKKDKHGENEESAKSTLKRKLFK